MLPFLPAQTAQIVLEEEYEAGVARSEYLADLGSSYFYGGATSGDATLMASMDLAQREEDFLNSEDGERYSERLEAARFMESGVLRPLDPPEFFPGLTGYSRPVPSDDDIPF